MANGAGKITPTADMSNVIEGAIDIDFLEVLTLTLNSLF